MLFQHPLPPQYSLFSADEIAARIQAHRDVLGPKLVILGHHYQQDEVIRFADFRGDSLKLSQLAAEQTEAEYVVFCGVHFMAETADILTEDRVKVVLPDLSAGCSMADMAALEQLEDAWEDLSAATDAKIIPITYVNSAATIKAFCGKHGGACCTSSNARLVLEWALTQGDKVIFLPDQHLGRNTAYSMGYPLESMAVWDPAEEMGGLTEQAVRDAKFLLWKGHCSVHQLFTAKQCKALRETEADRQILVHPECAWEVVQNADLAGSTEYIIKTIQDSPAGSKWAIGTEVHLVSRLAQEYPDRDIRSLATIQCLCTTMYRISPQHLLWALDEIAAGRVVNQIRVPAEVADNAKLALQRMLENVSSTPMAVAGAGGTKH